LTNADELEVAEAAESDEAIELAGWVVPHLDYPTFRISLVAKVIDRMSIRRLNERGDLSFAEWRVLARLASAPALTVRQIADLAWVDRAEVSRAATALEERGLTTRKPNPHDARTPLLSCTPKGLSVYEDYLKDRQRFHEELTADLEPEEIALLDRILKRIAQRVVRLNSGQSAEK
jgi:DNA-binding MarR family transcriptional regulator